MRPIIKDADFRKELKGKPRAGYFFFGDEDYLKAFAVRQAKDLLCPDPTLAFFNEMRLDAVDFTAQKLLDALTPLPMMADRKLVTVSGLNFTTMRSNELEDLCEVLGELENYDYNLLIITAAADCLDPGYLPRNPSNVLKKIGEHLVPVQFERCTTAKLIAWIGKHFAHNGVEASPALCAQMADYCGHSMFVLANEIDKLCFYLRYHKKTVATEEAMRQACTPTTEYDAYAFANAIMDGKQDLALAILADYRFRRMDPLLVMGEVTRVICEMVSVRSMTADGTPPAEIATAFRKPLPEFKVKLYQRSLRNVSEKRLQRALEACVAADTALKLSAPGYAPLEKLICSL